MRFQQGVDALSRQSALDPVSEVIQGAVRQIYASSGPAGRRVEDAMYGTWLGHPLHPSLTDVVIGAWTAGATFDLLEMLGGRAFARCADGAVAIGTAAATVTAVSGLTDAQYVVGSARRIGILHGLLNVGATVLQSVSLVQRASGRRGLGRLFSAVSFAGLLMSAYLGGELIQRYRIGVNRAADEKVPGDYVPVLPLAELPENQLRQVDVQGSPVLLVRRGARIYAMHAICTHRSGNLAQGQLVDDAVQCPLHYSQFALEDGHVLRGPASFPEQCLATRVRDGMIEVGPGAGLGRCRHEPAMGHVAQGEEERMAAPAMP